MESIIKAFKRLNTPSRANLMLKLMETNLELLLGRQPNQPVSLPQDIPVITSDHIPLQENIPIIPQSEQQLTLINQIPPENDNQAHLPNAIEDTDNPKNRRHKYSKEMKEFAVEQFLKLNNYCKAALEAQKNYSLSNKIDESSVREWVASLKYCTQDQIDKAKKTKQARDPQAKWPQLDAHMRDYLIGQRKNKVSVNLKMIKEEAKQFLRDPEFKASGGWWRRARKRLNIVMRVATHVIQKLCSRSGQDIKLYLSKIQQLKLDNMIPEVRVELLFGNFDEVPLQFDMVSGRTYDFQGKKEICIQTTSGIKMRVTLLMAILSNGVVLPPLFIFKTKKAISKDLIKKYADQALIFSNAKGWISDDILLLWFERVWLNLKLSETQKPIIVFDQCRVHTSAAISKFLKSQKICYEIIPSGTTGYLHPLDVAINKPLKSYIKSKFDKWYSSFGTSEANTTPKGYRRPPSYDNLIRWTVEACGDINEDMVIHSFKTTGKIIIK